MWLGLYKYIDLYPNVEGRRPFFVLSRVSFILRFSDSFDRWKWQALSKTLLVKHIQWKKEKSTCFIVPVEGFLGGCWRGVCSTKKRDPPCCYGLHFTKCKRVWDQFFLLGPMSRPFHRKMTLVALAYSKIMNGNWQYVVFKASSLIKN